MAFPLALPLLLSGASTLVNTIAANKQRKAREDALASERMRQRQFDDESFALNAASRERYDDVPEQKEARSESLADMFKQVTEDAPTRPVAALPASSSNLVVQNETNETAEAKAETDDMARRRGELRSFADLFGDLSRMQGRDAGQLGMVGSFRRGSQNVLPLELEAAAQKGRGLMFLGDLLNAGAGLTMGPALGGQSLAAYLGR